MIGIVQSRVTILALRQSRPRLYDEGMTPVKVYGADWCEDTQRTLAHLSRLSIPFEYINVDLDKSAEEWIKQQNHGKRNTPAVEINERVLIEPTNDQLDEALGEPWA